MKLLKLLIAILMTIISTSCLESDNCCSEKSLFNEGWAFFKADSLMPINEEEVIKGIFPSQAVEVTLPHTPYIEPLVVTDQWQGICYYKKMFSLAGSDKNANLFLKFEGAMNVADVWVNGIHIIKHTGGYLPFTIDISKALNAESLNTVVVKLDNKDNPVTGPKPLKELDFNTYGGIYRNVWLIKKEPVYISDPLYTKEKSGGVFVRTSDITKDSAKIDISAHIVNSSENEQEIVIEHSLFLKNGSLIFKEKVNSPINANSDKQIDFSKYISHPSLWSPDAPNLYTLETKLYVNEKLFDKEMTQIGIRNIDISEKGLYLNGEKTFLRGVNRHQEYPYVGYALSDEAQYRDAYKIKEAGFDYVRSSHYPPSPAFLKACDELGIFVLDAILGWQYFGDSLFVEHAKTSAKELIRRDRNHPCILAWELSINETPMPEYFINEMNAIRNEEAPGTYTAGWVKGGYDIYIEARQHRKEVDFTVPFMVSEYGDWEYYAQNAGLNQTAWSNLLNEERNSRQPRESGEKRLLQQALNIQEAHNDNLSTNAFADGYWAMFDYNRGYAEDLEYSGIMDICRLPKFSYYFFRSQRSITEGRPFAKPVLFIASHWLPGVSKNVKVYSNCDEVELYLNGYYVARKRPDNNYATSNLNHPPFTFDLACTAPGTLQAHGYYKGQKVCSTTLSTPEEAMRIKLWADTVCVSPKINDLIFIHAQIVDRQGTPVNTAIHPIKFSIKGNGLIINNGSNKTLGGIASILVRIGNTQGKLIVEASNPQLESGVLELAVR